MSNKSDKPLAVKTIIGSLLAIAIAYTLLAIFSHQVAGNFKNPVYYTVLIILGLLFVWRSFVAYRVADSGTNDNSSRAIVIILALVIIFWAGGWVAGSNEKVAPGSPQMENLR
jgi:FlaG/FlaF family flagellin (archaellin)